MTGTEHGKSTTRTIQYGDSHVSFELIPADRRTLEIAVLPDGSVIVKAPRGVGEQEVLRRVARRARWILVQQRYFAQFQPRTPPRRYVGGETHLYLGRRYRLAIDEGDSDGVRLVGGWLRVTVTGEAPPERVGSLLHAWYVEKARRRLTERFDVCWDWFPSAGLTRPVLRLRSMRTRWGSMSPAGTLSLSPDLVRAPRECIDYVIIHELCHLVHDGHGPSFRQLLERVLPDWERRKHRLELTLS